MSCNGCRVLRKGCSEDCPLRPCLSWISGGDAQGHATVFLAKFFGRASLLGLVQGVPESQRPNLFQSLLYEACGRTISPVYGAVGLLWSGHWSLCQQAVDHVLKTGSPTSPATNSNNNGNSKTQQHNNNNPAGSSITATTPRSSSPILVPSPKPTSSRSINPPSPTEESGVDNPTPPLLSYYPRTTSVSPPAWQQPALPTACGAAGMDMWGGTTPGASAVPAQGVPLSGSSAAAPVQYWPMGMPFQPGVANGYPAAAPAPANGGVGVGVSQQGYVNGWGPTASNPATGAAAGGGYGHQNPSPEAYLMAAAAFQSYSGAMLGAAMDLDSLRAMYAPYGGMPGGMTGMAGGASHALASNGMTMGQMSNMGAGVCDMEGVEAMEGLAPSSMGATKTKPSSSQPPEKQLKTGGGLRQSMTNSKPNNGTNPPLVAPVARRLQPVSARSSFMPTSISPSPAAGANCHGHNGGVQMSFYYQQDRDEDSSCESGDFVSSALWAHPPMVQDAVSHRGLLPLLH